MKEIGSEFWYFDMDEKKFTEIFDEHEFFLAGRTALDYIAKDLIIGEAIESIYLPSYCCHTMIKPFLDNGIEVEFYNVEYSMGEFKYHLDFSNKCRCVLIMDYFGLCNSDVPRIIDKLKKNGKIVIEDATHSWFNNYKHSKKSDYIMVSFRKWTGLPAGAMAIITNKSFVAKKPLKSNSDYIRLREMSAMLKNSYVNFSSDFKETFLEMFAKAEELIECDFGNYTLPEKYINLISKIDYEKIIRIRRENSEFLIGSLKDIDGIEVPELSSDSTPLFVPINIKNGKRNELKAFLIDNNVYCPTHWPKSDLHKGVSNLIYEEELSLICDQRYTLSDMNRIANLIKYFLEGHKL